MLQCCIFCLKGTADAPVVAFIALNTAQSVLLEEPFEEGRPASAGEPSRGVDEFDELA